MAGCKRIATYRLVTSLRNRLPTGTETEIYEEIVRGELIKSEAEFKLNSASDFSVIFVT